MRRALIAVLPLAAVCLAPRLALARKGVRPLFEPTDLELEDTGTLEADLQVGAIRSPTPGPWRIIVPDLELDFGLARRVELDVDLTYSIQEDPPGSGSFTTPAPENLWFATKLGLFDWADDDTPGSPVAWALGAQLGPRIPVAPDAHGVGFEGLLLLGHVEGRAHIVLNAGAFVDPHPDATAARPVGLEGGLDLDWDLDAKGRWSVTGELGGVKFVSNDPEQLAATAGISWSPTESTELNVSALYGLLGGSDRYGALFGFTQKLRLYGGARN
jgi:hypothetical protein